MIQIQESGEAAAVIPGVDMHIDDRVFTDPKIDDAA